MLGLMFMNEYGMRETAHLMYKKVSSKCGVYYSSTFYKRIAFTMSFKWNDVLYTFLSGHFCSVDLFSVHF